METGFWESKGERRVWKISKLDFGEIKGEKIIWKLDYGENKGEKSVSKIRKLLLLVLVMALLVHSREKLKKKEFATNNSTTFLTIDSHSHDQFTREILKELSKERNPK